MVILAMAIAGQSVSAGAGDLSISLGGPGLIGTILIIQLVLLARRLLREGYAFEDIRAALLAEAQVQEEEAEVILKRNWLRRLDGMWHRLWAGKFGKWFFRTAGRGIKPPERSRLPSTDATEVVLGRAAVDVYNELPAQDRTRLTEVPNVVHRLESHAERLRAEGDTGNHLTNTVAALEKVRLALLRLKAGEGSVEDLTLQLERAKEIGQEIDRHVEARAEIGSMLKGEG